MLAQWLIWRQVLWYCGYFSLSSVQAISFCMIALVAWPLSSMPVWFTSNQNFVHPMRCPMKQCLYISRVHDLNLAITKGIRVFPQLHATRFRDTCPMSGECHISRRQHRLWGLTFYKAISPHWMHLIYCLLWSASNRSGRWRLGKKERRHWSEDGKNQREMIGLPLANCEREKKS